MNKIIIHLITGLFFIGLACQKPEEASPSHGITNHDPWLVPKDEIIHWDAEKDKIRSIDTTFFIPIEQSNLEPDVKVLAYHHKGETRIYPLSVMEVHEIVNDQIDNHYFSVTYCPLTASALAWNREINDEITTFGVSGKLFNNNLVPYDRLTNSHWSQMKSLCINGSNIGSMPSAQQLIVTSFSTISESYKDAIVLLHDTCDSGKCELKQGNEEIDPTDGDENNLVPGEKYFGITEDDELLLFAHHHFIEEIQVYKTSFSGNKLLVVGSNHLSFYLAFNISMFNASTTFHAVQNRLPVVINDNMGNEYDLFGNVISGPDKGMRLKTIQAYNALTYAWEGVFNNISVFRDQ